LCGEARNLLQERFDGPLPGQAVELVFYLRAQLPGPGERHRHSPPFAQSLPHFLDEVAPQSAGRRRAHFIERDSLPPAEFLKGLPESDRQRQQGAVHHHALHNVRLGLESIEPLGYVLVVNPPSRHAVDVGLVPIIEPLWPVNESRAHRSTLYRLYRRQRDAGDMISTMTTQALVALRRARGLSQRTAALEWGVRPHTIYRWESGLRPVPQWLERMAERERVLLSRIESQEKEIAELLLKMHRQFADSPRAERLPMGVARPGAAGGGRRAARA
jgi:hypothetical protein